MTNGLFIECDGHRTRLKWHRALRQAGDTHFTLARIAECLTVGGSVEIDVVKHKGGFAVLHSARLEEETDGSGWASEMDAAAIKALRLLSPDGRPGTHTVSLLAELCSMLGRYSLPPRALLQIDFKEGYADLTEDDVANFQRAVDPLVRNVIVSGGDADAILSIKKAIPTIRIGFDPSDEAAMQSALEDRKFQAFVDNALAAMPQADTIYLDYHFILAAASAGFNLVDAFHKAEKQVDAWTINHATARVKPLVARLLELRCDQITTDEPIALQALMKA